MVCDLRQQPRRFVTRRLDHMALEMRQSACLSGRADAREGVILHSESILSRYEIEALLEREGGTLSCAPSADAVAGNGPPLSWRPSADAVTGNAALLN